MKMINSIKLRPSLIIMLIMFVLVLSACGAKKEAEPSPTPAAPAAPAVKDGKNPIVTIEMDSGKNIKLELYPKVAPNTVNNFISLVKKGFYNGTTFHRVIPGFMIQGG